MDSRIDIAVCTFCRIHVEETLRSIAKLSIPADTQIHVIVADNDDTPSARELVENTARDCALSLTYIHAPARNISIARNACLDASSAALLAFIDDDELVTTQWLMSMLHTLKTSNADVVLGPVQAIYAETSPKWMKVGDFHSTKPVWVNNEIITGYSCNVLIKRSGIFKDLRFNNDLGRSGGEDTAYFSKAYKAGARFAYDADAIVTEAVPAERASLNWLLKRRFRSGQTHGLLLLESPDKKLKNAGKAFAKVLYCLMHIIINILSPDQMVFWLLRASLHAGAVDTLLGGKPIEQYGKKR